MGEIISVQSGAQNKIRVEFKFTEELKSLTTDYLKRSEALDFRMNNMKETLFNQIKASEFDLIVSLGKGETKIPRYFYYQKLRISNLAKIIQFIHILTMELKEMAIISTHN